MMDTTMQNNGWPFPDRPGVPVEPERDGWRRLRSEALEAIGGAENKWDAADNAATFVLHVLAEALGVQQYTPCDGTETWEGDVSGTVYMILQAGGVLNDADEVARHHEHAAAIAAARAEEREACIADIDALEARNLEGMTAEAAFDEAGVRAIMAIRARGQA